MKITIFTKRSIFLVFFISSTVNPLLAQPVKSAAVNKTRQATLNKHREIANILVSRGLDEHTATKKVQKLFEKNYNLSEKLLQICSSSELSVSKEELDDALAKYALFGKECDLNSYSSLIGLVQSIKKELPTSAQLDAIKEITT